MDIGQTRVVVAAKDNAGRATFTDLPAVWHYNEPGVAQAAFFWEFRKPPMLPAALGNVPNDMSFPLLGASKFGLVCLPPRSAGKMDINTTLKGQEVAIDSGDPGLHQSNTVDIEVIISGKVDIGLEGGESRTLTPGMCLVMGGVMHVWKNHYDEPCVFAIILTGATPAEG